MNLEPLNTIRESENWYVVHSHIKCFAKKRGQLKNFLEFNKVMKVAISQLQMHIYANDKIEGYINKLSSRYIRIKSALVKKPLMTRLFLRVVFFINRFEDHHQQLIKLWQKINHNKILAQPPQAVEEERKKVDCMVDEILELKNKAPATRGGFQNGGSTCFMAAALQCFNMMAEAFPKDMDKDFKKSVNEPDDEFKMRTNIVMEIKKLLEKTNKGETCSGPEINALRKLIINFNGKSKSKKLVNFKGGGDDLREFFTYCLFLFKVSRFNFVYTMANGKKHSSERDHLAPGINDAGELNDFELQPEGTYLIKNSEVYDWRTLKEPRFIPVVITRRQATPVPVPETITFSNLPGCKYNLIACAMGVTGHAISIVKENDRWIKYDDARVTPISQHDAFKEMETRSLVFLYRLDN